VAETCKKKRGDRTSNVATNKKPPRGVFWGKSPEGYQVRERIAIVCKIDTFRIMKKRDTKHPSGHGKGRTREYTHRTHVRVKHGKPRKGKITGGERCKVSETIKGKCGEGWLAANQKTN